MHRSRREHFVFHRAAGAGLGVIGQCGHRLVSSHSVGDAFLVAIRKREWSHRQFAGAFFTFALNIFTQRALNIFTPRAAHVRAHVNAACAF